SQTSALIATAILGALQHARGHADDERAWRHVLGHDAAGAGLRPPAHAHRRDQHAVAADEGAVLDYRAVLALAIEVAGDRAGADVDVGAEGRVADVAEVPKLRVAANAACLDLDVVADVHPRLQIRAGAQ